MKSGVLSPPKRISNGYGLPLRSTLNRSSPSMSGIVQPPVLENCGSVFHQLTVTTQLSILMACELTNRYCLLRGTRFAPRVQVIPTSSNDSIAHSDSGYLVWSVSH